MFNLRLLLDGFFIVRVSPGTKSHALSSVRKYLWNRHELFLNLDFAEIGIHLSVTNIIIIEAIIIYRDRDHLGATCSYGQGSVIYRCNIIVAGSTLIVDASSAVYCTRVPPHRLY
jgi:hypothetical protein